MNKMQVPIENHHFPWDHPRFRSWIAVARACQLMQQSLSRRLTHLDIKPPHLDILVNLYRFDGITQQELARKLLVGRSNMSMAPSSQGLIRAPGLLCVSRKCRSGNAAATDRFRCKAYRSRH